MELETDRLILRDFTLEDVEALARCREDERYWRYYEPVEDVAAHARQHVEWFVGWQKAEPRTHFQLAITLRDTGALIGDCGLRGRPQVNVGYDADLEADIGYELNPAFWGQGLATEAVRRIVDFGFRELELHRVWAFCLGDNEPSWRLMERLGMQREGVLRQNLRVRERWRDTYQYGILREEWLKAR
jgi:ribosomal-protein-alanine N-acetyltransferase